jgi:thiosulfate/3-mercaptopyruvate sulfurtransferase
MHRRFLALSRFQAWITALTVALSASAAWADDVFVSVDDAKALVGKEGVRFVFADSDKDYAAGHIPGSVGAFAHDLHYLDDVRKCGGLPMCEPTASALIGKLGIDASTEVIVYDNGMGPNASGDWFFLKLFGVPKVRILDGGLATWKAKGLPVDAKPAAATAKTFKPKVQRDMIVTKDEVLAATKDASKFLLLDARHNLDEYTGKTLQTALLAPGKEVTVARGGSIPTAVFSPWTKYAGNKKGEADKPTLKDVAELQKQLEKLKKNGYAPDKTVITYCHVGLGRGSFQYLALLKAGHKNVKLYVGSWNEWGNTPELPLGTTAAAE